MVGHWRASACVRLAMRRGLWLGLLVAVLTLAPGAPARAQDVAPAVTILIPLSERLRAQGHAPDAAEAAYLDADERVTEAFLQPLLVVLAFADQPQRRDDWRPTATEYLRYLARQEPTTTPVIPPATLLPLHEQAVTYRRHLRAAAVAWLAAIEANEPEWLPAGSEEYAAAERARLGWYRALWERYVGGPPPGG